MTAQQTTINNFNTSQLQENMFTTTKTTREKALVAVEATQRAMGRHVCCKSQYKFKCFSCGEFINRGDKITKCHRATNGMTLRYRGADNQNGLTMAETAFYQGETGKDMWVHVGCIPCYWDSLDDHWCSNEYSPPALRSVYTDWGAKISHEFDEWRQLTNHYDMEEFLEKHGYPQEKWMKDRITLAVTRFQAIWRGYLYKKAYPIALEQKRAKEAKIYSEFLDWCASLPMDVFRSFPLYCQMKCAATRVQAICRGYLYKKVYARKRRVALYQGLLRTTPQVGDHVEILMNANEPSETVYSGEVIEVQFRRHRETKIKVKYHYDGEVRKYTGKKFRLLKKECEEHKRKIGIDTKLTGRLNTARIRLMIAVTCQTRPALRAGELLEWRYHYPDGTPVE